jgi:hypothetical protein
MKTICNVLVAVSMIGFVSCANNSETTRTVASATPGQRTYSSEELEQTGKRTSGEQLQAADPSVTAQGSNR